MALFVDAGEWRWQAGDRNMPGTWHLTDDAHRTLCLDVITPRDKRFGLDPSSRPNGSCRSCEAEGEKRGIL